MPVAKWTIQAKRGTAVFARLEFETKREAMQAMQVDRALKTAVVRDGRDFTYMKKD